MKVDEDVLKAFRSVTEFHMDPVSRIKSLHFSDCGQYMVASRTTDAIEIYNCDEGEQTGEIRTGKYGHGLIRFTNQPDKVVQTSSKVDDVVRAIDLESTDYCSYYAGHTKEVISLETSPGNNKFITSAQDNTVRLWDVRSTNCQDQLELSGSPVVCIDPNGLIIAVGYKAECVDIYDLRMFRNGPFAHFKVNEKFRGDWTNMQFSPDGKYLGIGTNDTIVHLVDAIFGDVQTFRSRENTDKVPIDVAFTADGQFLLSGSSNGVVHTWNTSNKLKVADLNSDRKECISTVLFNSNFIMFATGASGAAFWAPVDASNDDE